jgi:hypothetical protein
VRPLRDILTDYKTVLERVYSPAAYAGRVDKLMTLLDRSRQRHELAEGDIRARVGAMETVHKVVTAIPEARGPLWQTFMNCAKRDTSSARIAVQMIAAYAHLGPFSRKVIDAIDARLAALDDETIVPAAAVDVTAARHLA